MGADITFENGDYYRDSYNDSNLAWIVGESYWACKNKAQRNEMMKKLAHIPDKLIIKYVDSKIKNSFKLSGEKFTAKERKQWLKCFIDKRNQLKKLLDAGELKVAKDGWSV